MNLTKVRNWHNLMPNVATLKNAYRDRPKKRSAGDDDLQDEDEDDNSDTPKKVPQSFICSPRRLAVCCVDAI